MFSRNDRIVNNLRNFFCALDDNSSKLPKEDSVETLSAQLQAIRQILEDQVWATSPVHRLKTPNATADTLIRSHDAVLIGNGIERSRSNSLRCTSLSRHSEADIKHIDESFEKKSRSSSTESLVQSTFTKSI